MTAFSVSGRYRSNGLGCLLGIFVAAMLVCAPAKPLLAQAGSAQPTAAPQAESQPPPAAVLPPEYSLSPGDDLSVTFPFQPELNHDGTIGPDGRFALPLLGNLALAGDTLGQAAASITAALRSGGIAENASPSLTVRHYGSNVYVGGQVKTPGVVQLVSGMDALQAIFAAGGLTDSAKTGRVAVIRRTADNHPHILYIDLKAYTQGKAGASTAVLEPRDVVFVPRSKIAEVDLWVDNYINKAIPFSRGINYSYGNYPVTTVAR